VLPLKGAAMQVTRFVRSTATSLALGAGLAVFQACAAPISPVGHGHPASRGTAVSIRTVNNKFLVPVVLNEGQTATFLLDTGASTTVITPDMARRLGADVAPGAMKARARIASGQEVDVSMIQVRSIQIGSARIDNLTVAVYPLPVMTNTNPPITVDGFLGVDFIGRFTMIVDPVAGTLTLQLHDPPTR
jgi:clan AA aspartic protease (TIGR02281 family)